MGTQYSAHATQEKQTHTHTVLLEKLLKQKMKKKKEEGQNTNTLSRDAIGMCKMETIGKQSVRSNSHNQRFFRVVDEVQ